MTNPEAPQDPTPAAAPTPPETAAVAESTHAAEDRPAPQNAEASASSGEGADEGDEHDESNEPEKEALPGAAGAGASPGGEKKRRRRRRKKKPGAHGTEAGAEGGAGEVRADTSGGDPPVEGAAADDRPTTDRPKKKEKKHGPPRERPPVNGGDIVFGKIIEINDEAILIDIPGKARAIFDRGEMLLPDDEDEARPPRDGEDPSNAVSSTEGPVDADAGAAPDATLDAPSDESSEASTTDPPAVHVAPVEGSASAEPVTAEAASPVAEATGDVGKEPKVPRVILEVGADFIGVVHNDGSRGGLVVLTHHPRRAERTRAVVEKAFNEKTPVLGLVTGVIKGGIEVDIDGMRAFAPGSHVDLRLGADLSHLVARRLPFMVTQYAKRGRDLVLSRRAMLEEEAKKTRAEVLSRLKVGEEVDGIVRSVVPFGAFVDIGGVEGLVPLQEMSHNRADGPSDVFKAGEPTRVKVTKVDEKGKIWLSRKATIPDPWAAVAQKYAQGTRHAGKVARIQPFGAFIELESGIDGLIHLADLSINRIESPSDVLKVGDSIEVVVSHVEAGSHRIALHPALTGDAANETPQRIAPHKPVKAKIVTIEAGGLVVRILGVTGRNARGYVTAAGTGTPRGTELRKVFKTGQDIEGKVIELDPRRGEVKLSIKALGEDQERNAYQQYRQQLKAEARFTFGDLLKKVPPR